jgi:Uma2 family endonuclease
MLRTVRPRDQEERCMTSHARVRKELLTAADFVELPGEAGYRRELVRGRIVREPGPAPEHGRIEVRLAAWLHAFVEAGDLGVVLTNTGFVLATNPDTVRVPDLAFVARHRIPGYTGSCWRFGPDLAVEILSPSNSASEMQEKVFEYLHAGSRAVWTVDPRRRTITVYKSARDIRVLVEADEIAGDDVLPGFRLALTDLFG